MFLANTHPTAILFDSGALHSFILLKFVAKHNLLIAIMKHTMLVSSLGDEMRTKHICPAISISIRGVDFLSNLIIIDSKGIDTFIGMDWLRKYDRVILFFRPEPAFLVPDATFQLLDIAFWISSVPSPAVGSSSSCAAA
jgi:hypothetical protein